MEHASDQPLCGTEFFVLVRIHAPYIGGFGHAGWFVSNQLGNRDTRGLAIAQEGILCR